VKSVQSHVTIHELPVSLEPLSVVKQVSVPYELLPWGKNSKQNPRSCQINREMICSRKQN